METQYTLDENKQPIKIETISTPIDVNGLITEREMQQGALTKIQNRIAEIDAELANVQQIPEVSTEISAKIQELTEVSALPIDIVKNETKI